MIAERIKFIQGDITKEDAAAIVNAANTTLLGGGGVDGAIHRAAGPELLQACRRLGGCPTGQARITPGFKLLARWVIHTVGPVWFGGKKGEAELLGDCYRNSLTLALEHELESIAFPCISTGAYRFPFEHATTIALAETKSFLETARVPLQVRFVCFSNSDFETYRALGQKLLRVAKAPK